jgi:hypothetical protein
LHTDQYISTIFDGTALIIDTPSTVVPRKHWGY